MSNDLNMSLTRNDGAKLQLFAEITKKIPSTCFFRNNPFVVWINIVNFVEFL